VEKFGARVLLLLLSLPFRFQSPSRTIYPKSFGSEIPVAEQYLFVVDDDDDVGLLMCA